MYGGGGAGSFVRFFFPFDNKLCIVLGTNAFTICGPRQSWSSTSVVTSSLAHNPKQQLLLTMINVIRMKMRFQMSCSLSVSMEM